jgi:hypothetical protein
MRYLFAAAAVLALALGVGGCDRLRQKEAPGAKTPKELATENAERIRKACASEATYDRLKEVVFDEAARIRNGDPRNLDPIAAGAVVRMERPLVKSRDDSLNITVCKGHFVLDLPPGAENAFDGKRRAEADVEYSAQAAADGSGLVYQIDGAEPIVYRLATFGVAPGAAPPMARPALPPAAAPPPASAPPPQIASVQPVPARPQPQVAPVRATPALPPPRPRAPAPPPEPARQREVVASGPARPAFNCRYAHTRTERLVCSSPGLAGEDRAMSSVYYGAIAAADPGTKSRIRASRDSFLRRREQCGGDEGCVARAYRQRIAEIRSLAGE